ncbi:hypothetical protein ACUN9Y_07090 [Halomonas sp. V046]|uniref:hypothetical protein n=1 Tax=Halomonas sp. V046 TaxID=3459611 RepID=UPI0040439F16
MTKHAVFTMKLESELRDAFMAEAAHRPASQVLRELMRDYLRHQQKAREYDEFLGQKVEQARSQRASGQHYSNEAVEAEAARRRAALKRRLEASEP